MKLNFRVRRRSGCKNWKIIESKSSLLSIVDLTLKRSKEAVVRDFRRLGKFIKTIKSVAFEKKNKSLFV